MIWTKYGLKSVTNDIIHPIQTQNKAGIGTYGRVEKMTNNKKYKYKRNNNNTISLTLMCVFVTYLPPCNSVL